MRVMHRILTRGRQTSKEMRVLHHNLRTYTITLTMDRGNPRELWEHVLSQVELSVSPANFNTWFRDSHIVKVEDGIVFVGVPSQFFRDMYLKKFHLLLLKIVRGVSYEFRNMEYVIVKDERRKPP